MRTYIACAVDAKPRWQEPRHLVHLPSGERLLDRLVRQLLPHGPVTVLGPDERYLVAGAALYIRADTPDPAWYNADALLQLGTQHLGDGRVLFVFGDTYLSDRAVEAMTSGLGFFGRWGPSARLGTKWGELFGFAFEASDWSRIEADMRHVGREYIAGRNPRGGFWELGCYWDHGFGDASWLHGPWPNFIEIDDESDDLDFPEDVPAHMAAWT